MKQSTNNQKTCPIWCKTHNLTNKSDICKYKLTLQKIAEIHTTDQWTPNQFLKPVISNNINKSITEQFVQKANKKQTAICNNKLWNETIEETFINKENKKKIQVCKYMFHLLRKRNTNSKRV